MNSENFYQPEADSASIEERPNECSAVVKYVERIHFSDLHSNINIGSLPEQDNSDDKSGDEGTPGGEDGKIPDDNGNLLDYEDEWDSFEREESARFPAMVDLLEYSKRVFFLVRGRAGLYCCKEVKKSGEDILLVPPKRSSIPWDLPPAEAVLTQCRASVKNLDGKWERRLYDDTIDYLKGAAELSADVYYDLLASEILHSYLAEKSVYSPIIFFFGGPNWGKSRIGRAMILAAYRGVSITSLKEAHIIRLATLWRASILIDVMDPWKKARRSGSEDVLLDRYETGKLVPRVKRRPNNKYDELVYYDISGCTIIISNFPAPDILNSRCVEISMPLTDKTFPNEDIGQKAMDLKVRLIAFRSKYLLTDLPDIPKPSPRRLGDILKPLLQIIRLVRPDREDSFLSLVREIEKSRTIDQSDTLEAAIVRSMLKNFGSIIHGYLSVKIITDTLNRDREENFRVSYKAVGWRLKAVGFRKVKTSDGCSAVIWDIKHIRRLAKAYGVDFIPETPETQATAA